MITFIIKTFKRKESCEKLVKSIREYYDYPILIANDDKEKFEIDGTTIYNLDFDVGLSAGRNFLIRQVKTPYFVLLDDDFIFTEETNINKFLELMEDTDFDLIGGALREKKGEIINYEGTYTFKNRILKYNKEPLSNDDIIPQYDFVLNFFIARTDLFENVKWDEKLKLAEHTAFFFDHKGQIKIGYCKDVIVAHEPIRSSNYSKWRIRGKQYMNDFCVTRRIRELHGLKNNIYKANIPPEKHKIDGVDFLIATIKRPESLEKLLFSIAEFYPNAKITIADQNKRFAVEYYKELWKRLMNKGLIYKPTAYGLGYDIGLSYCRNYLVEKTIQPYKLILDDDFVFTENTVIEKFVDILDDEKQIGIVGGAVSQGDDIINFEFKLERAGDILKHIEDGDNWKKIREVKVKETGCVLNFALIKKEVAEAVKWDDNLKVTEHTDFYLRMKNTSWKIIYTPEVVVEHEPGKDSEYRALRSRREFLVMMMKKHGLRKMQYLNGHTYELNGNEIIQYKV